MNLFRWSAFHLCFSVLVLPVLGQSSNMKIVIKPDQVIIIVVIVVIIFGVCCGVVTVACRNRKDLLLMAPEWMSFRRGPKIEEATEEDRIIFERAERRKQKRELREAAAADLEEGGGSGILDLPNTLPSPGDEKGDGQESLDTSLPQTSASGTDSAGSVRYARKHHRKMSRSSDPGGDHSRRGRAPRPAALDDAVASDPLSRWKRSRERQPGEGTEEEDQPSSSKARAGRGRRHSVSGASPELLSLASPGVASMGVGSRTFGRGMPTSGPWEANIHERGATRSGQYKLRFLPDHRVAGSTEGADGTAQISGSFNPDNHRVIWTEAHPWGSVKVTGHVFYKAHVAQISANFVASDGGKGKLDLSPSGG